MSDIHLPNRDPSDLRIDLEKGIFLCRNQGDTDSGNNSLHSSTTGTGSSKQSQPMESSFLEEDEEVFMDDMKLSPEMRMKKQTVNKNIIEVKYRGKVMFITANELNPNMCFREMFSP